MISNKNYYIYNCVWQDCTVFKAVETSCFACQAHKTLLLALFRRQTSHEPNLIQIKAELMLILIAAELNPRRKKMPNFFKLLTKYFISDL